MRSTLAGLKTAVAVALLAACSGTEATKPRIVDSVALPDEVVSLIVISSTVNQTMAMYPSAEIRVSFSYSSSTGKPVSVSCTVDAAPVSSCEKFSVLPGTHTAVFTATSSTGKTKVELFTVLVPTVQFMGKISMADGSPCPVGMVLYAGQNKEDSAVVQNDCSYVLPSRFYFGDTAVIQAIDPVGRTKNFFGRVPKRFYNSLNIVGVPEVWTIQNGVYAGVKVAIDLEAAYAPSDQGKGSSFYPRGHASGKPWGYSVGDHAKVIPTAFCRAKSTNPISANDSVGFWGLMTLYHQKKGRVEYAPAEPSSVCTTVVINGIEMYATPRNDGSAAGSFGGAGSRDYTYGTFNAYTSANFQSESIVDHEMTHVSGFGHTCAWSSVMAAGCQNGMSSSKLSMTDVAYIQLMSGVANTERVLNTRLSLPQAHQGERLKKGLPEEPVDVYEPVAP